ncbi:hypothetical protein KAR91_08425, partial [Candidatus Pacearchaeota archaeon]|nr:hypothetical protein [Candidatus Pacearchaeota archaeon]
MKAALFALTAIMIYAIQNVALEAELKKYHPVALSVPLYIFGFIVCMAHLTTLKGMGQELKFPPYSIIITYVAGYAVFGYFAQFFFLKAYNSGGS